MLGAGDVKPNLSPATTMFFVAETVLDPLNADAIIEAVPPVEPLLSCTSTTPLELVVRVEADRVPKFVVRFTVSFGMPLPSASARVTLSPVLAPREIEDGPAIAMDVPEMEILTESEELPLWAVTVTVRFLGSPFVVSMAEATPASSVSP